MEVKYIKDLKSFDFTIKNLSLVLGYFDGLHIGHMHLINYAKMNSSGPVGVVTLDEPLKPVEGQITTLEEKISLLNKLKIDYLFVLMVDENFRHLSYIDFINKILKRFNPKMIFCGNDYTFGYNAKGNVFDLKMAFSNVQVMNYVNDFNHEKISSSKIKELIKDGQVKEASVYLGRPYALIGSIAHGFKKGSELGRPTANLIPIEYLVVPKDGVYITRTNIAGKIYDSLTNIGTHPTINEVRKPTIETHIFNFKDNLYGKNIKVYFYKRLRDEIKFKSVDDLEKQIDKDIKEATDYLKNNLK